MVVRQQTSPIHLRFEFSEQRKTYAVNGSIETQKVAKNSGLENVPLALVKKKWNFVDAMFETIKSGRYLTSLSTPKSRKRQKGLKNFARSLPVLRQRW